MVLPAVLALLALCLGGVGVGAARIRAQDASADAARSLARGDAARVVDARLAASLTGATWTRSDRGDLVCVTVTAKAGAAAIAGLRVSASSCALGGGR